MSGGGSKPGERRGGRQRGSKNKVTVEREVRARVGLEAVSLTGKMPLDVILARMLGEQIPETQYQAAVDAAPYV